MRPLVEVLSKPLCPYCDKAKALLTSLNIPFTTRTLGEDLTKEELLEISPSARTMPQIIINSEVIGGYDQLNTYIENTGFNGTGWSL
jgi:glutaredoxin|tara:strand:- start:599 stop:859 length:261 start_codon:yes stop_codon:yes gene_type:complete